MSGRLTGAADWAIAAIVLVTAGWLGGAYVRIPEVAATARYYQETMAPSVMLACGRGLTDAVRIQIEGGEAGLALRGFLAREVDRFDCGALPPRVDAEALTALQAASRYLLIAVAGVWMVTGVSWSSLWWLFALLYGSVGAITYFAFRAFLARPTAALLTALLITSTTHLANLPHLRDYAKAPFFAGMVLITARLAREPVTTRALMGWCAAAGALMGLSIGVRFDMTLFLVFFAAAVLLFLPGSIREHARARLAAIGICLLVFLIVAGPVLQSFRLGNNSWHVIVLGLSKVHDDALEIRPASYELGVLYNDSYVPAVVNGFWQNAHPGAPLARLESPEYLRAAGAYFRTVAWMFPADLVLRAWAAVLKMSGLPFRQAYVPLPEVWPSGIARYLISVRGAGVEQLGWLVEWLPMIVAVSLSASNVRLSLLAVAAVLFFGGYSSLQFQSRHVFHLEVLPLLMLGVAAEWMVSTALKGMRLQRSDADQRRRWTKRAVRVAAVGGSLAVLAVVPVMILRPFQERNVSALFARYNAAVTTHERPAAQETAGDAVRFYPDTPGAQTDGRLTTEFFAADFSAADCDFDRVSVITRYEATDPTMDFSRPTEVTIPDDSSGITRVFFVAYSYRDPVRGSLYRFVGLELPRSQVGCLTSLARIAEREPFSLLVNAQLSPSRPRGSLFKTLLRIEAASADQTTAQYVFPPDAQFRRSDLTRRLSPLGPQPEYTAAITTLRSDGQISVRGRPQSPSAYLVEWKATDEPSGTLLVADGEVTAGRLTVGLEHDRQWAAQVPVAAAGRFRVVIRVPADGSYSPVIASDDPSFGRVVFTIHRIGWIR